jgi:hypothetical protein
MENKVGGELKPHQPVGEDMAMRRKKTAVVV